MTGHAKGLVLRIKMSPRCIAHLPLFVEVTLANEATGAEAYHGLTACNPWAPPFPIEFALRAASRKVTLPAGSDAGLEESTEAFDLAPGESRTWVLDLSELDTPTPPGTWQCTARWVMPHEHPRAAGPSISIEPVRAADVPLIGRLRLSGDADGPTWANLIEDPEALHSPELRGLSAESRRALAPYLILHEAVHGPEPLSRFPLARFWEHQHGPWASEAAVLRYELAWARQAPELPHLRASILASWPGVAYRLDEVDQGAGLLTAWRDRVGPEGGKVR